MAKINIKESLLNLDKETYCKYDLTTMYENCNITEKDKEKLAKMLSENVSTQKVHNYLLERFIQDKNKFVDDLQECDKLFVKEDLSDTNEDNYLNTESIYKEIQSKQIPDMDGFMTDYTWYLRKPDQMNVFVYGDKDYYKPEDGYFDYETENSQEAREWFNSYNGFEDDDDDSLYDDLLYEGTIKNSKGKWTNKGEEGTHGTFDTKKEADAQRKAMFASGYKGESLKEDTQLKLFDDDMLHDIDVLYGWRPQEVEHILIKHGSDKNNDNWIDGLDLPAAYDEIMATFRDKYSDDDEIDYDVAKVLGLLDESLKESVNSDIVSMIKKQFPKATIKTSVLKHSDVHKSNPDTPRGKSKYVNIRITPDSASSVNSILQYCNHNIKKILDSDNRFYYYGDTPARNPRGGKEVIISYNDYSDLSDDDYNSLLGESKSIKESNKIAYGNEKYKGYMIRQDHKYGGYNVYDREDEMEDSGFKTIDKAKEFIDSLEESKSIKESSLVDKKVNTIGKRGKPMYFTANQLKDAKEKYPEYDFEETTIEYPLPSEQKAYIARRKTNESYGGAYDILDDQYFTKEDGMEAANEVEYKLEKEFPEAKLEVIDMELDNHSFYVALMDKDGNEFTEEITLDRRKIRHPLDLIKKYAPALTERFIKQIKDFYSEM